MKLHAREIPFTNGVAVLDLKAWGDFPSFVQENENLKGYIFRGHARASFKLAPTLLRLFERRHRGALDAKDINGQLERFRLAIRGRIHLTDREAVSSSELWAIGQHHGLATILLDWTASPLVAAFFAFIDDRSIVVPEDIGDEELHRRLAALSKERDEPRSVVALNAKRLNEVFYREVEKHLITIDPNLPDRLTSLASFADDERAGHLAARIAKQLFPADMETSCRCREALHAAELEAPRVVSPLSGENQRLVNQRGLFTEFLKPEPLEDWVKFYFTDPPGAGDFRSDEAILVTVKIPNAERGTALTWLDAANINYLSLFPDLSGAAEFANTRV